MDKHLKLKLVSCAVIAALSQMSIASAEEAAVDAAVEQVNEVAVAVPTQVVNADEAEATAAPLNLDRVVVTGTAKKISKMKSSVSISTKSLKEVQQTGATNAAEILRSIPGVRAESSGGEGNANMTVRGLPISAGGSRYFTNARGWFANFTVWRYCFCNARYVYACRFWLEVTRGDSWWLRLNCGH